MEHYAKRETDGLFEGLEKPFLIAEIGSNHLNDLEIAKESIEIAADLGADAVKFQALNVSEQYHNPDEETRAFHKTIDLAESWYPELAQYASKAGIKFSASPTHHKILDEVLISCCDFIKVASAQVATAPYLLRKIGEYRVPTIISTGMVTADDLSRSIKIFEACGDTENLAILHCNARYPCPITETQLALISNYRRKFNLPVGFSDHTTTETAAIIAIALGAKIIEKHFKMNDRISSPDSDVSITPKAFANFRQRINETFQATVAINRNELHPVEKDFKTKFTNYAIARKQLAAGEFLKSENLVFKRVIQDEIDTAKFLTEWDVFESNGSLVTTSQISADQLVSRADTKKL